MVEKLMMMRHLRDQDNLHNENNSPVIENELLRVYGISAEIVDDAIQNGFSSVHIITSNKARAEMTAKAVASNVGLFLPATYEVDSRIRELDQGKYILPQSYKPGDYFQPLQDAWNIFFDETFSEDNITYRFGDPMLLEGGTFKYPQIEGIFEKYGENQIEFSIRFYSFLLDLCMRFHDSQEVLPLVVTHQALAARISEVGQIMSKIKNGGLDKPTPGSMPKLEWQVFQENKNSEMFIGFGDIAMTSLQEITELMDVLNTERDYLRSLQV